MRAEYTHFKLLSALKQLPISYSIELAQKQPIPEHMDPNTLCKPHLRSAMARNLCNGTALKCGLYTGHRLATNKEPHQQTSPPALVNKTVACMQRRSFLRHHPGYLLSLRMVLAHVVSYIDPLREALPLQTRHLVPLQRSVDAAMKKALRVPVKINLYAPLPHGGFDVTSLTTRFSLRFIHPVYGAATSRNSLVLCSVQHLLKRPQLPKQPQPRTMP